MSQARELTNAVKPSAPAVRSDEAGFLLIEAVVAITLIAVCAGLALAAVAAVMHANARSVPAPALTATAQNILTDLRAATAYDPAQLSALAGRSAAFDADEPRADGLTQRVHIVATIKSGAAQDSFVAVVTVRASNGTSVTIERRLVQEAPAPGSVVPAQTPAPCDPPLDPCAASSGGIAL